MASKKSLMNQAENKINPVMNPVMNPVINPVMNPVMNPVVNQKVNEQVNQKINPQINVQRNQQPVTSINASFHVQDIDDEPVLFPDYFFPKSILRNTYNESPEPV